MSSYNSSGAEQLTLHAPAVLALDGKTKRAIEDQNFPFEHLSELAELESWRKEVNRPIYHLHKWWAQRLLLARDARRVWQMANRLPPLRVVDKAGSLAAHPRSTGRRDVTGNGDQITVTDAVGLLLVSSSIESSEFAQKQGYRTVEFASYLQRATYSFGRKPTTDAESCSVTA